MLGHSPKPQVKGCRPQQSRLSWLQVHLAILAPLLVIKENAILNAGMYTFSMVVCDCGSMGVFFLKYG